MQGLQQQTANLFVGLSQVVGLSQRPVHWPGTLTLSCGPAQNPALLAILGLGGASLALFSNANEARVAGRLGATDFTVDTLSEALRILKNELRQRRAIGVALLGDTLQHLAAMLHRGVQPQFLLQPWPAQTLMPQTSPSPSFLPEHLQPAIQTFMERGATLLNLETVAQDAHDRTFCPGWSPRVHVALTAIMRREEDRKLLQASAVHGDDSIAQAARQWMEVAPRLFPRDLERHFWTRQQESRQI